MKSHLTKLSLALLSATFLLGCQDLAPVGPDGLVPQFARNGKGKPPSGNTSATVTLAGGMMSAGFSVVGKDDDQTVTLNINPFNVGITMNFTNSCIPYVGKDGRRGGILESNEEMSLQRQLGVDVTGGAFFLEIDKKTGLKEGSLIPTAGNYVLQVHYDGDFDDATGPGTHPVSYAIIFSRIAPAKVTWTNDDDGNDVFTFTGPILVVAGGVYGRNGRRGNRAIACGGDGDNSVTVTVLPPVA